MNNALALSAILQVNKAETHPTLPANTMLYLVSIFIASLLFVLVATKYSIAAVIRRISQPMIQAENQRPTREVLEAELTM